MSGTGPSVLGFLFLFFSWYKALESSKMLPKKYVKKVRERERRDSSRPWHLWPCRNMQAVVFNSRWPEIAGSCHASLPLEAKPNCFLVFAEPQSLLGILTACLRSRALANTGELWISVVSLSLGEGVVGTEQNCYQWCSKENQTSQLEKYIRKSAKKIILKIHLTHTHPQKHTSSPQV